MVEWLFHTLLLDCNTHPALLVSRYALHCMTVCEFLLHGLSRWAPDRKHFKVFSIVMIVFRIADILSASFKQR